MVARDGENGTTATHAPKSDIVSMGIGGYWIAILPNYGKICNCRHDPSTCSSASFPWGLDTRWSIELVPLYTREERILRVSDWIVGMP